MSSTKPQDYDPYLDGLLKYQRKLNEVHEILKSKQSQINPQDYETLKISIESLLHEIKEDIKERGKPPRFPPYR